ncbi:19276_t:CDS:2 [Funneliformis geosporum]|uniref:19276_t:CDS:1 n=1 Tax=Funneliformis geosporum TaxID=1117311 RepID=A0A9W4WNG6_9GLOM|nr:19276_t:CDS:2 [Funneliformis geosporum]
MDELIEVPFGISSSLFIARVIIIHGFPFQHIKFYPELENIYMYIGKIVQNKIQSVNPERILEASQIRDKFGDRKKFLYREINSHNNNAILSKGFMDAIFQGSLKMKLG